VTLFSGLLVDSNPDWSLRLEEGVLVVQGDSIVERSSEGVESVAHRYNVSQDDVVRLTASQFLLPGLIDTHIHASQFPNAGLALDLTLLDWLEKYTFPTEAGFSDPVRAEEVYTRCVRSTLSSGTTTACYFATIHTEASLALANICRTEGQRAFVGKVCMDRNSPETYSEETSQSLESTKAFVKSVLALDCDLVQPIITPRFVPSCSRSLMSELGKLASSLQLPVQTHLAENRPECHWVRQLEPDCQHYTEVYRRCGLLGSRTVLAHCCHLSQEEVDLISLQGAGVSHCPNSNFSLKSGVCDVRRLQKSGVKVGLGTDCSGGFSPSLLNSMRMSVMASNTLTFSDPSYQPLQYSDALYLATRGGAQLLGLQDSLGALQQDMKADLLLVDMAAQLKTQPFGGESSEDLVSKFVFLSDDRNIKQVWVAGRRLKDTASTQLLL